MLNVFSFKPAGPIYSKTSNYGHFGKIHDKDITWGITNKADALKKVAK